MGKGVAVLVSGTGSILESILAHGIDVTLVAADRVCPALERAEAAGIPAELVRRTDFGRGDAFDRDGYTNHLVKVLQGYEPALIVSAGFGTVVPGIAAAFPNQVINTHPALLPAFKGWHAVSEALAAGVKVTGCTVHIVTEEMDAGPILAQEAVAVLPDDTEESLHERIKAIERELVPKTIKELLAAGFDSQNRPSEGSI